MTGRSCPLAKLEKLLLATDRSPFSEGAVAEAIAFAKQCASHITAMTAVEANPEYETIGAAFYEQEEKEAIAYMGNLRAEAEREGISCETILRRGQHPPRMIVEEAARAGSDLIVLGKHGRSGPAKLIMGSTAGKVIADAPCKVLVVPQAARISYGTILLATDGSDHGDAALSEAAEIAKRCGSRLIALSVAASVEELVRAKVEAGDAALLAENIEVSVETLTPIGKPHVEIAHVARERLVDLIVMGAYGKKGLRKLLMGSTTEKVIGASECAVLVVKAFW